MRILFTVCTAVWLAVAASAFEVIRVSGSDLLGEEFTRAVAEFARQNDVEVKLELRGTRPGLEALKTRRADVGLFLLPPGESLPAEALVSKVVAYQVAVVVVPAASPLKQVTLPQLRGMFAQSAGEAFLRWGELNVGPEWTSRPIVLLALNPTAGLALPLFQRVALADGATKPALELIASPEALAGRLAVTPNAIAVTGLAGAESAAARVLAVAGSATGVAYAPTSETIAARNYPLSMPLYVVFRRESARGLQPFLKFILSDEVATALAPAHFVGLPSDVRNSLVFDLEEIR